LFELLQELYDWLFSYAFWDMCWAMVIFFGACFIFSFIPAVVKELLPAILGKKEIPDNDKAHTKFYDHM